MTNELIKVAGNVPVAAVKNFENFSGNLFQSIIACKQSSNERKVRIAQISAELQAYLGKLEKELTISLDILKALQMSCEQALDKTDLTFQEKKEFLEMFTDKMLKLAGC